MVPHQYTVDLQWISDRRGRLSSPELLEGINVATPPNFPKGMDGIWSPEHFFTAAVSSCFMTTFLAIAENSKLNFEIFKCHATGLLDKNEVDGKLAMTEINLFAMLVITDAADAEKATRILQKAEHACLITNSIKSTVHLHCDIQIAEICAA